MVVCGLLECSYTWVDVAGSIETAMRGHDVKVVDDRKIDQVVSE